MRSALEPNGPCNYLFAANNPLRYVDPEGLAWWNWPARQVSRFFHSDTFLKTTDFLEQTGAIAYGQDVQKTYIGMGKGGVRVGKNVGHFFGDIVIGGYVTGMEIAGHDPTQTVIAIDESWYGKGGSLGGSAGRDGHVMTPVRTALGVPRAVIWVRVHAYEAGEAAWEADYDKAGQKCGESLTVAALLASPFAKTKAGFGGYEGVGTPRSAIYRVTPTALRFWPNRVMPKGWTAWQIRMHSGQVFERYAVRALQAKHGEGAVVTQLQIRPRAEGGVEGSSYFVADSALRAARGGIRVFEMKASGRVPLRPRQAWGFPRAQQYGVVIKGLKGGELIPRGAQYSGAQVHILIIRPAGYLRLLSGVQAAGAGECRWSPAAGPTESTGLYPEGRR
jgi:hypothetical protein